MSEPQCRANLTGWHVYHRVQKKNPHRHPERAWVCFCGKAESSRARRRRLAAHELGPQ